MNKLLIITLGFFLYAASCDPKKQKESDIAETSTTIDFPYIERLDPKLDELIASGTEVEVIAEGHDWTEGPVWVKDVGLLFSDIPQNKIFNWNATGGVSLYLSPSGYTGAKDRGGEMGSNGLLLDPNGKLILCQHGDRRVARMLSELKNPEPRYETIVDSYNGKQLNSPNDGCFDSKGNLYFTDPPYGLEKRMDDPSKELDFQGVYRYSKEGELNLLIDDLTRPNGIALSPDERTLYVANSDPKRAIWMAYDLGENGSITEGNEFYNATNLVGAQPGLPDGLKVDAKGNVFASGPGGIWIFNAAGALLGKVKTGQATSNCAIGNDGEVLYITADMYVMKVNLGRG